MAEDQHGRILASSRDVGRSSDLYDNSNAPEIFVDGIGNAIISSTLSRVGFFKLIEIDYSDPNLPIEKRKVELKIIIPSSALLEFAAGIVASAASSIDQLAAPNQVLIDTVKGSIDKIKNASSKA